MFVIAAALVAQLAQPQQPEAQVPAPPPSPLASATAGAPAADPADVWSPASIVAACYSVISGDPGPRNWARFRSLFLPGARLTVSGVRSDGSVRLVQVGVEDYVARNTSVLSKDGFFERGVENQTLQWAHTAMVRSLYESRHSEIDAKPFDRGVNYFQLANDGRRWWIASLAWEQETSMTPIAAANPKP